MSTEGNQVEAVSRREFARRAGVTHRAVQLAIDRGDIPAEAVLADGRLDFSRALVGWTARDSRDDEPPKLAAIRAKLLELEYLKAVGLLVAVADVRRAQFQIFRRIRDQFMNVPDQLAAALAGEANPARVHALAKREIEAVLTGLSDWAEQEAESGEGTSR